MSNHISPPSQTMWLVMQPRKIGNLEHAKIRFCHQVLSKRLPRFLRMRPKYNGCTKLSPSSFLAWCIIHRHMGVIISYCDYSIEFGGSLSHHPSMPTFCSMFSVSFFGLLVLDTFFCTNLILYLLLFVDTSCVGIGSQGLPYLDTK